MAHPVARVARGLGERRRPRLVDRDAEEITDGRIAHGVAGADRDRWCRPRWREPAPVGPTAAAGRVGQRGADRRPRTARTDGSRAVEPSRRRDNDTGRQAVRLKFFAVFVPLAYLALIIYLIVARSDSVARRCKGGDAAALVGGIAALTMFGARRSPTTRNVPGDRRPSTSSTAWCSRSRRWASCCRSPGSSSSATATSPGRSSSLPEGTARRRPSCSTSSSRLRRTCRTNALRHRVRHPAHRDDRRAGGIRVLAACR